MGLLKFLANVSPFRAMPTDPKASTSGVGSVPNETVSLYYYNSGTLTADAGQAAGVLCVGKLANRNILNALGNAQANKLDTSLTFTSTAFTSEIDLDPEIFERVDGSSGTGRLQAICAGFSNGDYCVDYATGTIYGKKASTQTSLTATAYKHGVTEDLFTRPAQGAAAITPHDTTKITGYPTRGVYVGVGGTVVALMADGTTGTFVGVPTGTLLPIAVQRINNTSTTATTMVALF